MRQKGSKLDVKCGWEAPAQAGAERRRQGGHGTLTLILTLTLTLALTLTLTLSITLTLTLTLRTICTSEDGKASAQGRWHSLVHSYLEHLVITGTPSNYWNT